VGAEGSGRLGAGDGTTAGVAGAGGGEIGFEAFAAAGRALASGFLAAGARLGFFGEVGRTGLSVIVGVLLLF